ncbi:hypothetical protein QFC19_008612 [Naganishia cerealis]|uniref:Uncharacterized protein n=1 Tax=Naganishia cerealis TaxID=610337 RepID=A0ACC2V0Z2_9TREE|nr:hypothetical protein QFC19_008612 [Naganishia cerealis]
MMRTSTSIVLPIWYSRLRLPTLPLQLDSVQNKFETSEKDEQYFTNLKRIFLNKVNRLNRSRDLEVSELLYTGSKAYGNQPKRAFGIGNGYSNQTRLNAGDSNRNGVGSGKDYPKTVQTVNGMTYANEVGTIRVVGSAAGPVTFLDVYYKPNAPNLLSYGTLVDKHWDVRTTKEGGHIAVGGKVGPKYSLRRAGPGGSLRMVTFERIVNGNGNTARSTSMNMDEPTFFAAKSDVPKDTMQNWHERLGHKGISSIKELAKLELLEMTDLSTTTFTMDIYDYTGTCVVIPIPDKTAETTLRYFRAFKAHMEKAWEHAIKAIRTDGGGEYMGNWPRYLELVLGMTT